MYLTHTKVNQTSTSVLKYAEQYVKGSTIPFGLERQVRDFISKSSYQTSEVTYRLPEVRS